MFLLSPTPIPSPSPTPSTTPSTSVTPTPGPGVVVEELIDMSAGLTKGCGNGGGMICDFVQMIVPVSWAAP